MLDEITDFKIKSLEKLKSEVLTKYLNDINLDFEMDLYDKVVDHFTLGDLDLVFDNYTLRNKSVFDKKKILNIVHKYQNMCFYNKNKNYWTDSIPIVPIEDYNLILYELLENFDLLVKIYLNAGEDALKLIYDIDKENFYDNSLSVVENLKKSFVNEEVLLRMLKRITSDEEFNLLSSSQKRILLNYAEGILYTYNDHNIKIVNPTEVSSKIYFNATNEPIEKIKDRKEHLKNFYKKIDNFSEIIENIYYEYQQGILSRGI